MNAVSKNKHRHFRPEAHCDGVAFFCRYWQSFYQFILLNHGNILVILLETPLTTKNITLLRTYS